MRIATRFILSLVVIWELPLAALSLLFHRTIKFVVIRLGLRHYRVNPGAFMRWRVLSRDYLESPHSLARYMLVGPRWNTHAIVATAGPFRVERTVSMDLGALIRSAQYWAVGAKHFPSFEDEAQVGSLTHAAAESLTLELPPGDYYIACRYYLWSDKPVFPAVCVDGQERAQAVEISSDVNEFYQDLQQRSTAFYLCVHYYVHALVKWRRLFSEAWIRRELLPVGNQETRFHYGVLRKGEGLEFRIDPAMLETHRVYCTVYDRASFPFLWFEIAEAECAGPSCARAGVYLVRVVQIRSGFAAEDASAISVQVRTAAQLSAAI